MKLGARAPRHGRRGASLRARLKPLVPGLLPRVVVDKFAATRRSGKDLQESLT
jgi:hypothetical protein